MNWGAMTSMYETLILIHVAVNFIAKSRKRLQFKHEKMQLVYNYIRETAKMQVGQKKT